MLQFLTFCQFQLKTQFLPPCLKNNNKKKQTNKKTCTFDFQTQPSAWFESYLFNRSIPVKITENSPMLLPSSTEYPKVLL